ncbi:iron-containing redox enzyme-domain containing protein, partial [Dunaliella salina]
MSSDVRSPCAACAFQVILQASSPSEYATAEAAFKRVLATPNLDARVRNLGGRTQHDLRRDLQEPTDAAHLFLQRLLYFINRLNHFWFDELDNYVNERSVVIASLRNTIEGAWAEWELQQLPASFVQHLQQMHPDQIKRELDMRYEQHKEPPPSESGLYIASETKLDGYRQLLAVGSLDGLTEASRQSRVCAGAANPISNAVFRILMEVRRILCKTKANKTLLNLVLQEYGSGQLSRKHSTFYASMMRELGLSDKPETYLDLVPWQALAGANHNFMLTETRRGYLRYLGALTYFEIVGPSVCQNYVKAARRLGLSEAASWYWELHMKEDERHGKWMLQDVAKPAVD